MSRGLTLNHRIRMINALHDLISKELASPYSNRWISSSTRSLFMQAMASLRRDCARTDPTAKRTTLEATE
jgi:hypothetical protein